MMRFLKLALGFGLGGLFLWLTLREVDFGAIASASRHVSVPTLALAPLCLALGYAFRIQRWRLMLLQYNPVLGFGRTAIPFVASIAVNNLAPFRMGDVLRCFAFSGWLGVAPGTVIASVVVERLLDLTALILALSLAIWVFSVEGDALGIGRHGATALAALGLLSVLLLFSPGLLAPLVRAAGRLAGRVSLAARTRIENALQPVIEGLTDLSRQRVLVRLVVYSLPVWVLEGAAFWAVARAMPALDAPRGAWLAMPTGTLSTLLPSTPGHVGTFDFFTQMAMTAAGNSLASATAFALLVHVMLWLTTTLTGGACLAAWSLARRKGAAG